MIMHMKACSHHFQRNFFIAFTMSFDLTDWQKPDFANILVSKLTSWHPKTKVIDISYLIGKPVDQPGWRLIAQTWPNIVFAICKTSCNYAIFEKFAKGYNLTHHTRVLLFKGCHYFHHTLPPAITKLNYISFLADTQNMFVECQICCERSEHCITCTNCGNKLCQKCVQKLFQASTSITKCPFCRDQTTLAFVSKK